MKFKVLQQHQKLHHRELCNSAAWRHILLGGNYSFEDQVAITNLDSLLEGVDPLSDGDDTKCEK
ncbi:hypothetical protein FCJ58_22000 [Salmonella enterica]|nr:hypothetical protein [Salmonella enterica]